VAVAQFYCGVTPVIESSLQGLAWDEVEADLVEFF
jgi:hypothetical protein